jgi:putative copper resistance protein D
VADPLIAVRAIHFAAAMLVAGIAVFELLVAGPATWEIQGLALEAVTPLRTRLIAIMWGGLAVAVISGAAWLLFLAAKIADQSVIEAFEDGTAWMLFTQTRFGMDWQIRLIVAALLSGCLILVPTGEARQSARYEALLASLTVIFVGTLAWSGHGGASPGLMGYVHLAADVLHLTAASTWLGGLVPLVLWLGAMRRATGASSMEFVRNITRRFSNLGIAAVGTLLASGTVNTWFMTGGGWGLTGTSYGRLLLVKIALFLAMVGVAAINRQHLLPQLSKDADGSDPARAEQRLERNAFLEIALGLGVIIIVGLLGIEQPGMVSHFH